MSKRIISLSMITLSFVCASFSLQAKPLSVGFGASWTDSPYKGYGSVYYPLPHIVFENEMFFINNFTAGAYLYNDNNQKVSIGVSYLPLTFKPKDSDDYRMKRLDKRHATLLAEARYSIATYYGNFAAGIGADVLNESNSVLIGASYSYPIYGNHWVIEPKVGFLWSNDKHNNYYYGVSHNEAARSGLAYHDAKSSMTPYMSLVGSYAVTKSVATYVGVRFDKLTGDAKNSPMINNSIVPSVFAGINYTF